MKEANPQTFADPITIKLLHERRSGDHRKIDGRSGKLYLFRWEAQHRAYCYTTANPVELDDIFSSQGRALGCYFAPVLTVPATAPIPDHVTLSLLKHDIDLPKKLDAATVASALVAAFERGIAFGQESAKPLPAVAPVAVASPSAPAPAPELPPVAAEPADSAPKEATAAAAAPTQQPRVEKPKGKSPPPLPPRK